MSSGPPEQGGTYEKTILIRLLLLAVAMPVAAQYKDADETPKDAVVKRDETVKPEGRYANMPDEAVPYRRFTKPYYDWFVREDTLQYNGAADLRPDGDPAHLNEIAIGFMSPVENNPESVFGIPALTARNWPSKRLTRAAGTMASLSRSRFTTNRLCGERLPPSW